MPPTRNAGEPSEAKIVTELGKEFNVDEVYGTESFIGSLKSVNDFIPVEVPSNRPLNFDMMALEVCDMSRITVLLLHSFSLQAQKIISKPAKCIPFRTTSPFLK